MRYSLRMVAHDEIDPDRCQAAGFSLCGLFGFCSAVAAIACQPLIQVRDAICDDARAVFAKDWSVSPKSHFCQGGFRKSEIERRGWRTQCICRLHWDASLATPENDPATHSTVRVAEKTGRKI
jgi:hypothetical protein